MKSTQIALFLTVLFASSQALNGEIFKAVFSDAIPLYKETNFFRGIVLGFQQDITNTEHQCYVSFDNFAANITVVGDFFTECYDQVTYASDSSWTDFTGFGVCIQPIKRIAEVGVVFFNFYSYCFVDDVVISVGRTVNSFSGGFNTLINFGFRLFSDADVQDNIVSYAQDGDAKNYGIYLGYFLKKLLNVQVPDYQYTDY
jgi:hypothetical protein